MSARGTVLAAEAAGSRLGTALRWGLAAGVVLAVHATGAWTLLARVPETPPAGVPEAAVLIDLAPPVAAPEIAATEAEIAPEPVDVPEEVVPEPVAEPEPVVEPEPEPIVEPEPVVEPEPIVEPEPVVEPEPEPIVEPEPVVEEPEPTPEEELEVAGIPLPTARPTPPPRRVVREEPRREEPRRQQRRPEPQRQQAQPQRRQAPAPSTASQGQQQRQASQGAANSRAPQQSWQGQVLARVNRAARRYTPRTPGNVSVSFTIGPNGAVSGLRVVRSSGDAILDQAAIAAVTRAGPFPSPPSGEATNITIPVNYRVR